MIGVNIIKVITMKNTALFFHEITHKRQSIKFRIINTGKAKDSKFKYGKTLGDT